MRPAETVRGYPFREPVGLALAPEYAEPREHEPVSRIRLPYGGDAWLVIRHADVRVVLSDPNSHVAFGFGPHYCVAAQLAKAELRVAIGTLLRRFPALRLADEGLPWRRGRMVRGLDRLPVTW